MTGDKERLLSMGMTGYTSKPIEQRALMHEIHRVLSTQAVPCNHTQRPAANVQAKTGLAPK